MGAVSGGERRPLDSQLQPQAVGGVYVGQSLGAQVEEQVHVGSAAAVEPRVRNL